jgi:hypothetical protein
MSRRYQCFVAPGDTEEDLDLPIDKSLWHTGRSTYIPSEHWEIILEYVKKNMPGEYGDLFEKASFIDSDFSEWSMDRVSKFRAMLEELCSLLKSSQDIACVVTETVQESYPNSEYVRMLQAVIAVTNESLKISESFDSYVTS